MSKRQRSLVVTLAVFGLAAATSFFSADSSRAAGRPDGSLVNAVGTRHVLTLTVGGAETQVEIYGWDHRVESPRDAASGLPTGKRQHKPFVVTKSVDEVSPLLLSQFLQGGTFDSVRVESFRQPGRKAPMERYITVEMTDVLLGSYQVKPQGEPRRNRPQRMEEEVSIVFHTIRWTFADGSELSDTVDLDP